MAASVYFNEENDYSEENLRKIHVTIKSFGSTIPQTFQIESGQKKCVITRSTTKKLNILTLQLPVYSIQEISTGAYVDIAKMKREKQTVFTVEGWMQCLLFWLKFRSTRKACCHPAIMGNYPTISHTC